MTSRAVVVIAGASLAGAKAAEALRSEGFDGRVVLIGEEPDRPYERPPLSKAYLRGEVDRDSFSVHDEQFYVDQEIDLLTSTSVVSVDPEAKSVTLDDDQTVAYDQLLISTGATPRRLSMAGADLPGIHYLRSLSSCEELRFALTSVERLVVVGGGWIGSEVAASVRQMGKEVAIIEAGRVPLERVLGPEAGQLFGDLHRDHGVELHMGVGVQSFRGSGSAEEVVLDDGTVVTGDLFVVGVGAVPRTELARSAGAELDNGVVVDQYLATNIAGIWAAGDVANAYHPLFGHRVRLEHWSAALNQGPIAAKNMLGRRTAYDRVPYFFSDQYDLSMEYTGLAAEWDQIVYRGDPGGREFIVFWLDRQRVVAGMNVNVWDVADQIADLVAARRPVDVQRLADVSIPLTALLGNP